MSDKTYRMIDDVIDDMIVDIVDCNGISGVQRQEYINKLVDIVDHKQFVPDSCSTASQMTIKCPVCKKKLPIEFKPIHGGWIQPQAECGKCRLIIHWDFYPNNYNNIGLEAIKKDIYEIIKEAD